MLRRDPSAKAIVFSQFTSMLDLVAFRLEQVRRAQALAGGGVCMGGGDGAVVGAGSRDMYERCCAVAAPP